MSIRDAFDEIDRCIKEYQTSGLIVESNVTFDFRVSAGYVRGTLTFSDSSQLHFREFLADSVDTTEKLDYFYHYQTADASLIFRYDNAKHRPPLGFTDHKHTPKGIIAALQVSLREVLDEIYQILMQ